MDSSGQWAKQRYGLQSVTHLDGECNAFLLSKKDLWRGSLRSMHSSSENIGVFTGEHLSLSEIDVETSVFQLFIIEGKFFCYESEILRCKQPEKLFIKPLNNEKTLNINAF